MVQERKNIYLAPVLKLAEIRNRNSIMAMSYASGSSHINYWEYDDEDVAED